MDVFTNEDLESSEIHTSYFGNYDYMRTTGLTHTSEIFGTDPLTFPEVRPVPALCCVRGCWNPAVLGGTVPRAAPAGNGTQDQFWQASSPSPALTQIPALPLCDSLQMQISFFASERKRKPGSGSHYLFNVGCLGGDAKGALPCCIPAPHNSSSTIGGIWCN